MILYIANRGEIAFRILKTAKKNGFKVVVGYSDQDRDLPFVTEADDSVALEGSEALQTYLNVDKVIAAAKKLKATHLHPGYGFLSENANFVRSVSEAGIKFVGPSAEAMEKLGDKVKARRFLKDHGISLLPSYEGDDQTAEVLIKEAKRIGFPVLIKPSAGGGGKGMMRVDSAEQFFPALESAQRIALSAFKDERVFLEKFIPKARHIEVQILGDEKKHVETFGIRECTLQRRHQKMIEETPCVFLGDELEEQVLKQSKTIAEKAHYSSAGTVEWIWDGHEGVYFLEVNARLQVEHPVTELVWGVDLVEWQLRVANGESIKGLKKKLQGHAMELRICAEDPLQDFIPSGGKIHRLKLPEQARCDFGYREKNFVPAEFDSLIGKVIVHGTDRKDVLQKAKEAVENLVILGPRTNRSYLRQLVLEPRVQAGALSTDLISEVPARFDTAEALHVIKNLSQPVSQLKDEDLDWYSPWGAVPMAASTQSTSFFEDFLDTRYFHTPMGEWTGPRPGYKSEKVVQGAGSHSLEIKSPMPAKVIRVSAEVDKKYTKGATLFVVEAMKMEHHLKAPQDLVMKKINVAEGDRVQMSDILGVWE